MLVLLLPYLYTHCLKVLYSALQNVHQTRNHFLMPYFHPKPTPNNHTRFIIWYAFSIRDAFPHPTFISVPMLKLSQIIFSLNFKQLNSCRQPSLVVNLQEIVYQNNFGKKPSFYNSVLVSSRVRVMTSQDGQVRQEYFLLLFVFHQFFLRQSRHSPLFGNSLDENMLLY